jgi:hypothetical protein
LTSTVWCTMSSYRLDKSVTGHFYVQVLQRSCDTPSHISLVMQQLFLAEKNIPTTVISLHSLYSESGPQRDTFCNHGGHEIECDGQILKDSKRNLPPVFPTMAGSKEQVCVCLCVYVCVKKNSTLKTIRYALLYVLPYRAIPPFRELFDCPSFNFLIKNVAQ